MSIQNKYLLLFFGKLPCFIALLQYHNLPNFGRIQGIKVVNILIYICAITVNYPINIWYIPTFTTIFNSYLIFQNIAVFSSSLFHFYFIQSYNHSSNYLVYYKLLTLKYPETKWVKFNKAKFINRINKNLIIWNMIKNSARITKP